MTTALSVVLVLSCALTRQAPSDVPGERPVDVAPPAVAPDVASPDVGEAALDVADGAPAPPDRLAVALSGALGAVVGGILGSSLALAADAALAGYNEAAQALPIMVLPALFSALGAGAGGALAGSSRGAWAGALVALGGAGAVSLALSLAVLDGFQPAELPLVIAGPAAVAGLGAGVGAAIFAEE